MVARKIPAGKAATPVAFPATKKPRLCNIMFGHTGKDGTRGGYSFGLVLLYRAMSGKDGANRGVGHIHQRYPILNMDHFSSVPRGWNKLNAEEDAECGHKDYLRAGKIINKQTCRKLIDFIRILNVIEVRGDSSRVLTIQFVEDLRECASRGDRTSFKSIVEGILVPLLKEILIADLEWAPVAIGGKNRSVLRYLGSVEYDDGLEGAYDHEGFEERMQSSIAVLDAIMKKGTSKVDDARATAMSKLEALRRTNAIKIGEHTLRLDANESLKASDLEELSILLD